MTRKLHEHPRRLVFTFECVRCGNRWRHEFIGTLFGSGNALDRCQGVRCPGCGASRDPRGGDQQPCLVGLEESDELIVFEPF